MFSMVAASNGAKVKDYEELFKPLKTAKVIEWQDVRHNIKS